MSWFNRKAKNRKLGNTQVLDVKLRSDQVRATRMRLGAMALALVFATVFGFYLVWRAGEFALNRLIYQNKSFAVQEIEVRTDGVLAPDQLRRWAGVITGENLLALDLPRVKRDLEMVSMIRSVAVERVLPHTLRLRVSERDPLAQIHVFRTRADGGLEMSSLHLDGDGYLMALAEPRQLSAPATQTNDILPLITGINQTDLAPGKRVDSSQAKVALQLISAFDHSPMSGLVDLETIDVSAPEVLQVKASDGSQVTLASRDLDQQLRRWRKVYDQGLRLNQAIATLDLSVPNSIPAVLVKVNATQPVVPKAHNLQHNRKKNV